MEDADDRVRDGRIQREVANSTVRPPLELYLRRPHVHDEEGFVRVAWGPLHEQRRRQTLQHEGLTRGEEPRAEGNDAQGAQSSRGLVGVDEVPDGGGEGRVGGGVDEGLAEVVGSAGVRGGWVVAGVVVEVEDDGVEGWKLADGLVGEAFAPAAAGATELDAQLLEARAAGSDEADLAAVELGVFVAACAGRGVFFDGGGFHHEGLQGRSVTLDDPVDGGGGAQGPQAKGLE